MDRKITRAVAQTPHVPDDPDPLGVTDADRDEARKYIRWLFEQRIAAEKKKRSKRPPPVALGPVVEGSRRDPKPLRAKNKTKPAAKKPVAKKLAAKPAAREYFFAAFDDEQTLGEIKANVSAPKVTYMSLLKEKQAERN